MRWPFGFWNGRCLAPPMAARPHSLIQLLATPTRRSSNSPSFPLPAKAIRCLHPLSFVPWKDSGRKRRADSRQGSVPYLTGNRNSNIIAQDNPSKSTGAGPGMARKKHEKKTAKNGANLGFEQTLWQAADKLRGNMDASDYKHVVLGLIFLKYISDAFEERALAQQT
jgi:hypothetical protein